MGVSRLIWTGISLSLPLSLSPSLSPFEIADKDTRDEILRLLRSGRDPARFDPAAPACEWLLRGP